MKKMSLMIFIRALFDLKNGAPSISKRKACEIFKSAPLTMQK
jgi:hypothetical protein